MTDEVTGILEQIRANNDPNNPARIKARSALANMNQPTPSGDTIKIVKVIGHNGLGDIKALTMENGENWVSCTIDF